jgi:Family of unknown function (DUF6535)
LSVHILSMPHYELGYADTWPQAGLFSAVLTAFVVDSKQNLKPSPAEETVYYLRQHSTILSQISVQLSSIAPQVTIPSTPPPPFPSFSPLSSDIRVNIFWFMALTFSLLAALLAILVQQWVRNYMHVFQRYGDALKSSRLRHYLFEGCERWNMPRVAEAVPGLLHISLFLFFAGLSDSLLNINTKVALSTIVPISVSGLLYVFAIFAPIIYPQSPYQNIFSDIIWYLVQTSRGRRFRDHESDGEMKPVSANMARGQMQLAMEETAARKGRDVGATRWLIDNLTEDAEMEKFLSAIPCSFNTDWGVEVWKRLDEHHDSEDQGRDEAVARPRRDTMTHQPSSSWSIRGFIRPILRLVRKPTPRHPPTHATTRSPVPHPPNVGPHSTTAHIQGENVVHELSTRVARSLDICKNRGLFANDDLWRKRTRPCIEATASLICCTNAKLAWFGDISKPLGEIGSFEKIREQSVAGADQSFVMRWTCLSLVVVRPILADAGGVQFQAKRTMQWFSESDDATSGALETAQKIDKTLKKARNCLFQLYEALCNTEDPTEVKEILRGHESQISELEQINMEADGLYLVNVGTYEMQRTINRYSHRIISQFPGVLDEYDSEFLDPISPIPFSRLVELSHDLRKLQFIRPRQTLKGMCIPALILRNILEGQWDDDAYKELLKNLENFRFLPAWQADEIDEMQRQFWRLQDLGDGGGLGFTVELFFLAFSQLLSTSSSKGSHSALYTGTFRAITSDWSKYKDSRGTQKLLLYIAVSRLPEFNTDYPAYIADEFLLFLGHIFEGQTGPHIDRARQQFESSESYGMFRERMLRVLTRE